MKYLFQLGFSPKLASLEISSLLRLSKTKHQKTHLTPSLILIEPQKPISPHDLIQQLGGTVRISQYKHQTDHDHLVTALTKLLIKPNTSKPNFSVSSTHKNTDTTQITKQVKQNLNQRGFSSRFVLPSSSFLNPIQISSQNIIEFILVPQKTSISIFQTIAVSPVLDWQNRDQNRPIIDPQGGMLPPKVARIMVNLSRQPTFPANPSLLDPFCGSGTILQEALLLGFNVYGSDIDSKAISSSTQNIIWLQKKHQFTGSHHLFTQDVLNLNPTNFHPLPHAIVTETDLGPEKKLTPDEIKSQTTKHHNFYSQVMSHLGKLQPAGSSLVIALPQYRHPSSENSISSLIDTCEKSGYTLLTGPITYSKPRAQVKRAISVLIRS